MRLTVKGHPVTDKLVAAALLAEWHRDVLRGGKGLADPFAEHRARPLGEHLADYVGELRAMGRDGMYAYNAERRLGKLRDACGWATLDSITADAFCQWRDTVGETSVHAPGVRIGPRTKNQYLDAVRAFCRWAVKRGRMESNPVATVGRVDETADVRRARRALSEQELVGLLRVVRPEHGLAYRIILATGLRRDELAQLQWGDVRLNSPQPFLQLRASTTKSKRADVLPLRQDLAALLRESRGAAADADRVCPAVPTMEEHWAYLTAAGIDHVDERGRRADLHALRHTYGSMLAKAGIAPRVAMTLMRHTDLRLTMNVYSDPRIFDLAGAVEKLPALSTGNATASAVMLATGTGGDSGRAYPDMGAKQGARPTMLGHSTPSSATICDTLDSAANPLNTAVRRDPPPSVGETARMRHLGLEPRTR